MKLRLNLLLLLASILATLAFAEFVLRASHHFPGFKTRSPKFRAVDSLSMLEGFEADSNGIMRISESTRQFFCSELSGKKSAAAVMVKKSNQYRSVYRVLSDYKKLSDEDYTSALKSFMEQGESAPEDKALINAVKSYTSCPINTRGFRSIEFNDHSPKAPGMLLLGDSFTWGYAASNITSSFADLLLARGLEVYNTGIIGTDPAQYLQIAKTLIPALRPEYVVVNFYMGNDVIHYERKPLPYVPVYYCTNAGNLLTCPEGIYFKNLQEAYEHNLYRMKIHTNENLFSRLCFKTTIGTLLWLTLEKLNLVDFIQPPAPIHYDLSTVPYYEKPYSNTQLAAIKDITEQHNSIFILTVIPSINREGKLVLPEDVPGLFEGLEYFVPPVSIEHYQPQYDGHYNDKGHALHAAFIDSLRHVIHDQRFITF